MFESLKDEIAYFHDVSVFAGFTGSGLTNSMFMNPGQTVIEIVCPIKFSDDPSYEIHNFYKTISMLKKHKYVAISNINNSKENLLNDLEKISNTF
jgi:capsular polysaccharide biosynthesis protein